MSKKVYNDIDETFRRLKEITTETDNEQSKDSTVSSSERSEAIVMDSKYNKKRMKIVQEDISKTIEIPKVKPRKKRQSRKNTNTGNSRLENYGIVHKVNKLSEM